MTTRISRSAMRMMNVIGVRAPAGRRAPGSGSSSTGRPSRRTSRESASDASSASCVTSTIVVWRMRRTSSRSCMIGFPVVESRLPVGSSASDDRRIVGERAGNRDALLLAPESCDG